MILFVSCFKWDPDVARWMDTDQSVNIDHVERWAIVEETSSVPGSPKFGVDVFFAGDPPRRTRLIAGAPTREDAGRFMSTILSAALIPHWPPGPDTAVEIVHEGGRNIEKPGEN